MTVRLLRPYAGQAAMTVYTGSDEDVLKATGSADDNLEGASDYATFKRRQQGSRLSAGGLTSALQASGVPRVFGNPSPYRVVASRGKVPHNANTMASKYGATNGAAAVRRESRRWMPFLSVAPSGRLWIMFQNSYISGNAGGEMAGPTGVTIMAGLEVVNNGTAVSRAIKFPAATAGIDPDRTFGLGAVTTGDQTTYTPAAGEIWFGYVDLTDYGFTAWPANADVWVRTSEAFTSGVALLDQFSTTSSIQSPSRDWTRVFDSTQTQAAANQTLGTGDITGTAGNVGTGNAAAWSATAILGTWGVQSLPSVLANGDSILTGSSLTFDYGADVNGGAGNGSGSFQHIACRRAGLPFVDGARGSDTYQSFNLQLKSQTRKMLMLFVDQMIDEMGINSAGPGADANLASMRKLYTEARSRGVRRIIRTTLTPQTTSTDNWATLANQTLSASRTVTKDFNAKAIAMTGRYDGPDMIVDVSGAISSPLDPDKFLTNEGNLTANYGVIDGLHPSQLVQPLAATPLQSALAQPLL